MQANKERELLMKIEEKAERINKDKDPEILLKKLQNQRNENQAARLLEDQILPKFGEGTREMRINENLGQEDEVLISVKEEYDENAFANQNDSDKKCSETFDISKDPRKRKLESPALQPQFLPVDD